MQNPFTLHCIAWQAGAPLLQEVRAAALEIGLLNQAEVLADEADEVSRHALVLGANGRGIGCARITPEGRIERMAVLPHEQRAQIETAMIEILNTFTHESKRARTLSVKPKRNSPTSRQGT